MMHHPRALVCLKDGYVPVYLAILLVGARGLPRCREYKGRARRPNRCALCRVVRVMTIAWQSTTIWRARA